MCEEIKKDALDALDAIRMSEEEIENLRKAYGDIKVNLSNDSKDTEGIWATPCSQSDKDIYDSDNSGVSFRVRLLNSALNFLPYNTWGVEFLAVTAGQQRPTADVKLNHENITKMLEDKGKEIS